MSAGLYMDVHVHGAITRGLRARGVDVLTAQDDGAGEHSDAALLDRAKLTGRALFTHDDDFFKEAARRQRCGEAFAGVIYAHPQGVTIGQCIRDLELIAKVADPEDLANRVEYLPLD